MVELPEVAKALTTVEKYIFVASTKKQVAEIDDETLIAKTGQMFRFIAMDVGFIISTENRDDWTCICTRLLDLLKRYYSQLTLSEVKLAFELLITGELDDYLPKDRDGNAERKHYQQFNADYFAKVLNAYCRKQNQVTGKAYTALPEPKKELSPGRIRYYRNQPVMEAIDRCRPPLLDLNIEEVMKRPRRSMFVYTIDLKYTELVDSCYTCKIKMYFDIDFEYPIIEIL